MDFEEAYREFVENCADQEVLRIPAQIKGMTVEEIPCLMDIPRHFTEVWMPESVRRIEGHAFDEWTNLCRVGLPKEMEYIGAYAFSETSLRELHLPSGIKYLGNSLCYGCRSLEYVQLGDGLETIGMGTFWGCEALRQIVIPASVNRIMDAAFQDCRSLAYLHFEGKVEAVAPNAFAECGNVVLVESSQVEQYIEEIKSSDLLMEGFHVSNKTKQASKKQKFMSLFNLQVIPVLPTLTDIDMDSLKCLGIEQYIDMYRHTLEKLHRSKANKTSAKERIQELLDVAVQAKCLGQYHTALELCGQALALQPANGVAFYNLAKILYLGGQGLAVLKALAFARLNVYMVHQSKLYGPAGHVYLDTDLKRQKTYIGEILAYRTWATGQSNRKPITGYELLCEVEGKRRLEERTVEDSTPMCKILLHQNMERDMYSTDNQHFLKYITRLSQNKKELDSMAREMALELYQNKGSMDNEVGKFDDDPCYSWKE